MLFVSLSLSLPSPSSMMFICVSFLPPASQHGDKPQSYHLTEFLWFTKSCYKFFLPLLPLGGHTLHNSFHKWKIYINVWKKNTSFNHSRNWFRKVCKEQTRYIKNKSRLSLHKVVMPRRFPFQLEWNECARDSNVPHFFTFLSLHSLVVAGSFLYFFFESITCITMCNGTHVCTFFCCCCLLSF